MAEFGSKMDRSLYQAAMEGNRDVLIQYKDRFEVQLTPKRNNVLHIAVMHGHTQSLKEILRICPPWLLGLVNSQGETPLHIAARAGHADIVRALFDFVDQQNNDIESGRSVRSGLADSVRAPFDFYHQQKNDIESGRSSVADIVRALFDFSRQQINDDQSGRSSQKMLGRKNWDHDTALHVAVQNGHLEVVKLLLEKDSTISYVRNKARETPLYLAVKKGLDEIVSEILNRCNSPSYGGPNSRNALHAAVIFGSQECTTKLLNWRRSLAKKADVQGWTPLHHAASLGHVQMVKMLLDSDKSLAYRTTNARDGKHTALHIAASRGHVEVIKVMISRCPDCWEMDNFKGQDILHIAVEKKKDNVVEYIKESSTLSSLKYHKVNPGNIETINTPNELRRVVASTDMRSQNSVSNLSDSQNNSIEALRKMADTHMIVAALVATVTFTAGLTMPGGYYGNDGPNPGTAILSRNTAFKVFIVTDSIALILSITAIIFYFHMARRADNAKLKKMSRIAGVAVTEALMAMMIAFVTGTYAVLSNSLALAIATCVIGSTVVLATYFYLGAYFHDFFAEELVDTEELDAP